MKIMALRQRKRICDRRTFLGVSCKSLEAIPKETAAEDNENRRSQVNL
jgi:hypothetical protein